MTFTFFEFVMAFFLGLPLIAFIVVIHEFGHLIVARLSGIRVEVFSVGFGRGPGIDWKGIHWKLGWMPLGGYCKMAGEELGEKSFDENGKYLGKPDDFFARPPWARLVTALAGPFFNVILSLLLFGILLTIGEIHSGVRPFISPMKEKHLVIPGLEHLKTRLPLPAEAAGIPDGFLVEKVDGKAVRTWIEFRQGIILMPGKTVKLEGRKQNGSIASYDVVPRISKRGVGLVHASPYGIPTITKVDRKSVFGKKAYAIFETNRFQARAGISARGREEFFSMLDFQAFVAANGGTTVKIEARANGRTRMISMPAVVITESNKKTWKTQMFGAWEWDGGPQISVTNMVSLAEAPAAAFQRLKSELNKQGTALGNIFGTKYDQVFGDGEDEVELSSAMHGPLQIMEFLGAVFQRWEIRPILYIIGLISLILGVINLFPIPALDGGFVLMSLIEIVRRKALGLNFLMWFNRAGLLFIVLLGSLVLGNDFYHYMTRFFS